MDGGIGAVVREVSATAVEVRATGARLGGLAALEWRGPGAAGFRDRLGGVQRSVRALAEHVEDAAALLRAHESALALVVP